jgi:hypothetical protein
MKYLTLLDKIKDMLNYKYCPICDSKIEKIKPENVLEVKSEGCKNGCFKLIVKQDYNNHAYAWFYIFEDLTVIASDDSKRKTKLFENKIKQLIQHWKENDRYLAELLSR